jgi:hypothetical protein
MIWAAKVLERRMEAWRASFGVEGRGGEELLSWRWEVVREISGEGMVAVELLSDLFFPLRISE